jgi:hypothetical protein
MKRYFLLGCIVAITPIMQSASANAADLGLARGAAGTDRRARVPTPAHQRPRRRQPSPRSRRVHLSGNRAFQTVTGTRRQDAGCRALNEGSRAGRHCTTTRHRRRASLQER